MKTEKTIKLKNGTTLPKGLEARFEPDRAGICFVKDHSGTEWKVRPGAAFHAPSLDELEEAANDGVCPSIAGETVEPDGWDCHGSPSWMLALGVI